MFIEDKDDQRRGDKPKSWKPFRTISSSSHSEVIRVGKDPVLLSLRPTVTTAVVNIALQLAANYNFNTYAADLKNAFMHSEGLVWESGRLF